MPASSRVYCDEISSNGTQSALVIERGVPQLLLSLAPEKLQHGHQVFFRTRKPKALSSFQPPMPTGQLG